MTNDTTKEKILKAAEELFAEKGFDKTSTASIAKRAGVNNALIFYYFDNKENLLKNIINNKINTYRNNRNQIIPNGKDIFEERKLPLAILNIMIKDGMEFMQHSENLLRFLTVETLKKTAGGYEIFQINETVLNDILKGIQFKETIKDKLMLEIKELFFVTIPMVMFTLLKQKMQEYYQTSEEELSTKMVEAFRDTYIHSFAKELGVEVIE